MNCGGKGRKKVWARLLVWLVLLSVWGGVPVDGGGRLSGRLLLAASSTKRQARLDVLQGENLRLRGMYAASSHPFFVPRGWVVEEASLRLSLSVSEVLKDSSLTVLLNHEPLRTVGVSGRGDGKVQDVTVSVPEGGLKPGWNTLDLQAYLRSTADPCQDQRNPGLWLTVLGESGLEVEYQVPAAVPDLSQFPGSYAEPMEVGAAAEGPRTSFLLGGSLGGPSLEVAGVLAGWLGQTGALNEASLRGYSLSGSVPEGLAGTQLIFVGMEPDLAGLQAWGIKLEAPPSLSALGPGAQAGLFEVVSPLNPERRLLLALARDAEGLGILAENVRQAQVLKGLKGSSHVFERRPGVFPLAQDSRELVRLERLLGSDLVLRGISRPSAQVVLPVPRTWRLTERAALRLYVAHATSLKRGTMLEVSLNGTPVLSQELLPGLGSTLEGWDELSVPIPASLRDTGRLEVGFRLHVDAGTEDCAQPYDESAWVSVRRDSYVHLDHGLRPPGLEQLPELLGVGAEVSQSVLLLGAIAESEELSGLLNLAGRLGEWVSEGQAMGLTLTTTEAFRTWQEKARQGRQVLMLARGGQDALLASLAGRLPLALAADGGPGKEALAGHGLPGRAVEGSLQYLPSPWDESRGLVVGVSRGALGARRLAELVAYRWKGPDMGGRVTLVDVDGKAIILPEPEAVPSEVTPARGGLGRGRWLPLVASVLGFAGALGMVWWLRRRRK